VRIEEGVMTKVVADIWMSLDLGEGTPFTDGETCARAAKT
jgi:hypothetical protein